MLAKTVDCESFLDSPELTARVEALIASSDNQNAMRGALLTELKGVLKQGREQAYDLLREENDGVACARRLSHLMDEIIGCLYTVASQHVFPAPNASTAERIAVTAVGGYGRGTLAPGSDIDLLFVLPYKQTAWGEQVVEYILYILWDLGLKVGHATRNIDECIEKSKEDMTIRTSILEVRFICGLDDLYNTLSKRFSEEVVEGRSQDFIAAKLAERDARHAHSGASRYRVEPNVKEGKGGLRDLHTLFWIGKYFHNKPRTKDLVEAGVFSQKQYRRFREAEKFLWTVRCHMHFLTGRAEERLSFDIQPEIARELGYTAHYGLSGVERFMKHYFLIAKEVGDLTLIACARLEEQDAKDVSGLNRFIRSVTHRTRPIEGTKDFVESKGRLTLADDKVFEKDPVNLFHFFQVAQQSNLDFHPDALQTLTRSLKLIDRGIRTEPEANRIFIEILTYEGGSERMLRRMNETGVLGKFIPAFRRIVAMMQFNMYHHFTVDEHLIRSVGALADLEAGVIAEDHPLCMELLPEIGNRKVLYMALFLHDIAKGRKEDHSIAGERVARQLCPRFGFSKEETDMVAWLIREHLTMSNMAQSRDLADRKTIHDFAEVVQEVERLRYLLILTVCDIRAVGPGVWNGWKGQLLRTLYAETELMLNGGFSKIPLKARVEAARKTLKQNLWEWSKQDLEKYTQLPYPPYFLSTDLEAQIQHMELLRSADDAGQELATTVNTRRFEGITEITVVAPDHPHLLSIITAACVAAGGNIADAKIHTTRDGRALDSIFLNRAYTQDVDEMRRAIRIGQVIEEVLAGETHLPEVIARDTRPRTRHKAFTITPNVSVNNDFSHMFSVIEIECLDRAGLLSEITEKLAELNLDIASAHVVTFGEKANDSFYVRDLVGHKITDPVRISKICKQLLAVMVAKPERHSKKAAK